MITPPFVARISSVPWIAASSGVLSSPTSLEKEDEGSPRVDCAGDGRAYRTEAPRRQLGATGASDDRQLRCAAGFTRRPASGASREPCSVESCSKVRRTPRTWRALLHSCAVGPC